MTTTLCPGGSSLTASTASSIEPLPLRSSTQPMPPWLTGQPMSCSNAWVMKPVLVGRANGSMYSSTLSVRLVSQCATEDPASNSSGE